MDHHRFTAVLTGAGSRRGIGRAAADKLAQAGFAIAVLDIDGEAAQESASTLSSRHDVPAVGVRVDVTDASSIDDAARLVERQLPPAAVLGNIAGITAPTRIEDITLAEWERLFAVNVTGTFLATQRFLPGMRERAYGRIINMSSVSAQRGGGVFGASHYSATKAAVLGFTKALAREVGEQGITVNAVAPGMVDTDITGGGLSEQRKGELAKNTLVGRLASADDVATVIAFLASPESGYITGATIDVNGGSHLH